MFALPLPLSRRAPEELGLALGLRRPAALIRKINISPSSPIRIFHQLRSIDRARGIGGRVEVQSENRDKSCARF